MGKDENFTSGVESGRERGQAAYVQSPGRSQRLYVPREFVTQAPPNSFSEERMVPLRITAELGGDICLPSLALSLDGLLGWAVSARERLLPIGMQLESGQYRQVEIPVKRSPDGRFHLASFARPLIVQNQRGTIYRSFLKKEMMEYTDLKRAEISSGPNKLCMQPFTSSFTAGALEFWCIGDQNEILGLLPIIQYIGSNRKTGHGKVLKWTVRQCDPSELWEGFPIVRDGKPMRPLPVDWPGLVDPASALIPLSYPYWRKEKSITCAVW